MLRAISELLLPLKTFLKTTLSSNLYGKLGLPDGLANRELEYKASLFIETCTESITVIQHFMLQKGLTELLTKV